MTKMYHQPFRTSRTNACKLLQTSTLTTTAATARLLPAATTSRLAGGLFGQRRWRASIRDLVWAATVIAALGLSARNASAWETRETDRCQNTPLDLTSRPATI